MQYQFPYDHLRPLDIPDSNLIGVFEAGQEKPAASPGEIVKRALKNPIGAPLLSDMAGECGDVLLLCDDNTRYTPAYLILPHIIDELHAGGISDDHIQILIASGSHALMSEEMLAAKLGKHIVETYTVEQHHHDREEELVSTGMEVEGEEFFINRRLSEADLIIGVGNIVPHMIKGFSGGGSIILPGVSGKLEAIGKMHWQTLESPVEDVLGVRDNKSRKLIEKVTRAVGLHYIVNTIVNNDTEILDVVAGDPIYAHEKGCEIAERVFDVSIPQRADIVIFDAFGNDLDFWQANKGLNSSYICMKQDALVILIADCKHGVCHNIPEIQHYGFKDKTMLLELHDRGVLTPIVSHFLLSINRMIIERGRCISVTLGISKESAEHVGLLYAESPQKALDKALSMQGQDASVIVLRHAGNIIPRIQDKTY